MNPLEALDKQAAEYNDRYAGRNLESERTRLRDEFAKTVLPQVYAKTVTNHPSFDINEVARKAYRIADAMLAARNS